MRRAAASLLIFGLYMLIAGASFVSIPNVVLPIFGFPPTREVFIRIVGLLMMFIGCYYIVAARHDYVAFYRWSILLRISVPIFFVLFVLLAHARPTLLVFAGVDLLGATWTGWALRADRCQSHA